ncbi:MAG: hypothetical protein IKW78_07625 [Prevotella sp.]|nr:hypothetical protein [Prevotella sp.]MBR6016913.1 hypothetical protein [Prevotella sp.]
MIYLLPEIRVRKIELESLLDTGTVGNTNNNNGDEDPGYGGGSVGPAYSPSFRNVWED